MSGAALTITNQAITQTTGGQVTFAGNVAADGGLDVTGNTVITGGTVTVGADGSGTDVILYSETAGDNFTWDASEEKLVITGTNAADALEVADGNVVFADDATVKAALKVGAGGDEFSITESSDDITLASLASDKDMIFKVNDGGAATEIFRLDGDVSTLKIASDKKIEFGSSDLYITNSDIRDNADDQVINMTHHATGGVAIEGGTGTGQIRFYEPSGNANRTYIALQAGNVSGDDASTVVTLTLPVDDGTSNQVLKTNGSGTLRWDNDNTTAAGTVNENSIGTNADDEDVTTIYNGTGANDGVITWYDNSGTGYFGMDNTLRLPAD